MTLKVTNIQRACVYDGPGVRTTVFLKGCMLHCPWCCNPETLSFVDEWFTDKTKCLLSQGINSPLCKDCIRVDGARSLFCCPFEVCTAVSHVYSTEELVKLLLRDKIQYSVGGGVTFSGGEPLLQADNLLPILKTLSDWDINIAFETTLVAPNEMLRKVLPYSDLFIVDLKLQREQKLPADYFESIQQGLSLIRDNGVTINFRLVVIPSMLNYVNEVVSSLYFLGVTTIELLQCHNMGEKKYQKLGKKFVSYSCPLEVFNSIADHFVTAGINITKLCL